MELTDRELYTVIHGLVLGTVFLLAFGGGFAGLWSLRQRLVTEEGVSERTPRLLIGTAVMAIVAWLTVITGTFIAYPWYRAAPPEGVDTADPAQLTEFPRYLLLAQEKTAQWHEFGMEWKEHVAWIAPMLATAVAFAVAYYGIQLVRRGEIRTAILVFFTLAFLAAGVAGLFGAFITKAAPVA
jgi:lipopolysaccharide export LptBFGC system permease protein LptF